MTLTSAVGWWSHDTPSQLELDIYSMGEFNLGLLTNNVNIILAGVLFRASCECACKGAIRIFLIRVKAI